MTRDSHKVRRLKGRQLSIACPIAVAGEIAFITVTGASGKLPLPRLFAGDLSGAGMELN